MSSSTSIGRGPAHGGNENDEGNPEHKTLGEEVTQEPPAGNDLLDVPDAASSPVAGTERPDSRPGTAAPLPR